MDDRPNFSTRDLASLVGSRLCHDLVNPLGAIGNGVELLAMSGAADGPEMSLIQEAVHDAQARIAFFRIAFGATTPEQVVSLRDIAAIIDGLYGKGGRLRVSFAPGRDMPRQELKLALLFLSCSETALPLGGTITMVANNGGIALQAKSSRLNLDPELFGLLLGEQPRSDPRPADVQFLLLRQEVEAQDRQLRFEALDDGFTLRA